MKNNNILIYTRIKNVVETMKKIDLSNLHHFHAKN